jgi:hypothetical protein
MMGKSDSSLPARLADALSRLVPGRPEAVETLRGLYTLDVVFRDPIQEVRGIDRFLALNHRLLRRMRTLEWALRTTTGDDTEVFLEWTMRGRTKLGFKIKVEGMTRARARGGKIFDHRDYWDLGELFASPLPGGQLLLHTLLLPFA